MSQPSASSASAAASAQSSTVGAVSKASVKKSEPFWLGGASSMAAACCSHPLDLLKVRLQTQLNKTGDSIITIVSNIIRQEGILSLYNGLSASLLRQGTYSTVRFGVYEQLKSRYGTKESPIYEKMLFATISGGLGGIAGNPADLVNVRMQNDGKLPIEQRRNYKHAIDGLVHVVKDDGVAGLFRGLGPNIQRSILMTVAQLASYDTFKYQLLGTPYFKDGPTTHFTASVLAGFVATIATNPVDVVKTRVMNSSKPCGTIVPQSAVQCAMSILKNEGLLGFYKGFVPSFVRLGPHTIVTFMVMEKLRKWVGC